MPNKTTAKKTTSKSGLKRRFDLTNRKVQFFVVIAIVAVLGGGYFTVRSFAATARLYTVSGSQLSCTAQKCRPVSEPQKNNETVMQLIGTPSPGGGATFASAQTAPMYFIRGVDYTICATAKGIGEVAIFFNPGASALIYERLNLPRPVQYLNNNNYTNTCEVIRIKPGFSSGNYKIQVSHSPDRNNPFTYANVRQVTVDRDLPTPTAPAPPAK